MSVNLARTFFLLWTAWLVAFFVIEGIAVYLELVRKRGDVFTFTHYLSAHVSIGVRVALLAWLAYHFLIQHQHG